MKLAKKLFSLLLVIAIAAALVIPASAASFSGGKGTSRDPYIVTTAQQLAAMRDNLSAHYKLGANIDLKGVTWKVIGTWAKPFTGSFTCDVDSTGKPIYAISNLKYSFSPPNYDSPDYRYEDYKADGTSGWEAGFFGVCNKATLSNIVLLNVDIINNAQGRQDMELYKDQEVNNPVWQMCAGGLAGTVVSTKVTNCGVTGKVGGESNHMGGFIGNICGSSVVKQCYAIVDVNGSGEWYTGGFVGNTKAENADAKLVPHTGKPTISECYYEGYVKGGWCNTGGFVGGSAKGEATFSDCYNRGTAEDEASGRSFFGQDPKNTMNGCDVNFKNCYSLAGLYGKDKASTSKGMAHCFVGLEADSKGYYPYQNGFTAADQATINAAFKNNPLWTVKDGAYPELKNLKIVRTAADLGKAEDVKTDAPEQGATSGTPDATTPSGEVDATEGTKGEADININTTIYDNTAQMSMAELVLVIVLLALIGVTLIGSIVTIILILKRLRK